MNCNSKCFTCLLVGLALLASGYTHAAEDHAPAPMMKAPGSDFKSDHESDASKRNSTTLNEFRTVYQNADSPTFVLYWNDKFATDYGRQVLAVYRKSKRIETFSSISNEMSELTVLDSDNNPVAFGKKLDFELESGFFQLMQHASAKLVERDSIVRLIGTASKVDDVVLAALEKYADIIVELQIHEQSEGVEPVSVLVTVTDIKSAYLLSKFSIDGSVSKLNTVSEASWLAGESGFNSMETDKPVRSLLESTEASDTGKKYKWVAGSNGYKKVEVKKSEENVLTPAQALGQKVAMRLMESLSKNGLH